VLLEVPSVIEIIDDLVHEADFLCIGTNDLVQYMLAADRGNRWVKKYYRPDHPAVLRGLARISEAVGRQKKELSICGEMAHEPAFIPFFLGIGVRILSLYPTFLPSVQQLINELSISDAVLYADRLLAESTLGGVHKIKKQSAGLYNLSQDRKD
jgi:phosphotransferase system enzyme I (PtsP)